FISEDQRAAPIYRKRAQSKEFSFSRVILLPTRNRCFPNPCNTRARNWRKRLMNMLLAQSLDAAMSEGLGIIAKFLFIVAVIVIVHGGLHEPLGQDTHR